MTKFVNQKNFSILKTKIFKNSSNVELMANKKATTFDSLKLLDEIPVAIFEFQFHIEEQITRLNYYNKTAATIFEKVLSDEKIKTGFDLNSILAMPELQRRTIPELIKILKKEPIVFKDRQYLLKTIKGKKLILTCNIKFVLKGEYVVAHGIITEVPQLSDAESSEIEINNFKQEINNFKEFFDAFDALIMIVNETGRILFVSPNISDEMLNKPRDEIINKTFHDIFPKGQADFFLSACREALIKERGIEYEYQLPIADKVKWYQSKIIPIEETEGELKKLIAIIKDITEWKIKSA
ncbi:MAG: PAS domain-containing protein [Asgard group archaeon]|nr:PAS domain-containing protein [Asgard group archaeon]